MPSTSAKQAKFMRAVAHSPKFAKQVGVKQSVGKDFEMADKKMKKFGSGGMAKKPTPPQPTPAEKAEADRQRESLRKAKVTPKEGKVIDSANRSEGGDGMKKGGKIKKYAIGGVTKEMPTSNQMGSMNMAKGGKLKAGAKAKAKMAMAMVKDRMGRAMASRGAEAPMVPAPSPAAPMGAASPMGGMKKGGGIERKGKTKGKMVKMAKGGSIDGIAQRGKTRCAGVHPGAK